MWITLGLQGEVYLDQLSSTVVVIANSLRFSHSYIHLCPDLVDSLFDSTTTINRESDISYNQSIILLHFTKHLFVFSFISGHTGTQLEQGYLKLFLIEIEIDGSLGSSGFVQICV